MARKSIEEAQKEMQAKFAANEARANSVWAPEDVTPEVVEKASTELETDEMPKAKELAFEDITDEDLVIGRNMARDNGDEKLAKMYQDEINLRASDGKEHSWTKADKDLADKRKAEKEAEKKVEEEPKDEGLLNLDGATPERLMNLYSMMKRQGGADPKILKQLEDKMLALGVGEQEVNADAEYLNNLTEEEAKVFEDAKIEEATTPEAQEEAVAGYTQKYDPKNNDDAVDAINNAGFGTVKVVEDENGDSHLEFEPHIMSEDEYSKEKGKGLSWLWKGLTLASVGLTCLTAGLTDGQVIPPIMNCMVFDNDLASYQVYKRAAESFIEQTNNALVDINKSVQSDRSDIVNEQTRKDAAKVRGEVAKEEAEPTLEMQTNYQKEMADYANDLAIELKNVDKDIQKEMLKAMADNDVYKAKQIANQIGMDENIIDNIDKAQKAMAGQYHISEAQQKAINQGYWQMGTGLFKDVLGGAATAAMMGSDKNIKTFVRPNGANDLVGGF